jgi:murein L,D-transpeptidase YcbB/YkuD
MHDTTQKFLFANAVRAESHGCMRVQNPNLLAQAILKRDKGWSEARVESTFDAGDDHHVTLDQKIPVYVTYFTLRVNEDGSFTSFNDLYGHDSRMTAVLEGRGYVSEPSYDGDGDQVMAGDWRPNMRRSPGGRGSFGSDFTRGLFGF